MIYIIAATFVAGAAIGFIRFRATSEPRFTAFIAEVQTSDAGIARDAGIGVGIALLVVGTCTAIETFAAAVSYSTAFRSQILAGDHRKDAAVLG